MMYQACLKRNHMCFFSNQVLTISLDFQCACVNDNNSIVYPPHSSCETQPFAVPISNKHVFEAARVVSHEINGTGKLRIGASLGLVWNADQPHQGATMATRHSFTKLKNFIEKILKMIGINSIANSARSGAVLEELDR